MKTRLAALALALSAACGGKPPPPLPPGIERQIEIRPVSEDGDEWLHTNCTYLGTMTAFSDDGAYRSALANHANFVEPLFRSTQSSTTNGATSSSSRYTCALFRCKAPPPAE